MKKAFFVALLCCAACSKPTFKIEGELKNMPDGNVFLTYFDSTLQQQYVDTTKIVEGIFTFDNSLNLPEPECVVLKFANAELPLFMGNDHITIKGDALKPDDIVVSGSEAHDLLEKYFREIPETENLRRLNNELDNAVNDIDKQNAIIEDIKQIREEQNAYIKKFIKQHTNQTISVFCLLNSIQIYEFEELDSLLNEMRIYLPKNKYVNALGHYLDNKRPQFEAQKALEIGKIAPDFELPSIDGKMVKLSSFRDKENGKTILLDFWASWCQPCRQNNKTIVEVYNKFADKGLEIISVSLDTQSAEWLKAVKEDKLKGTQLIDSTNVVAMMYCISSIPCCYLLDADGTILSKDIGANKGIFDDIAAILNNKEK